MSTETRREQLIRQGRSFCVHCGAVDGENLIERCVSCRSQFCMLCARRWHGKRFCSKECAEIFFFGDEED